MKIKSSMLSPFNRQAAAAFALAGSLAFASAACAQTAETVPSETDIQADVTINPGSNNSTVYSRKFKSLQACYNYLVTTMASRSYVPEATLNCSNSEGELLSSASCESSDNWRTRSMVCHDTTAQARKRVFTLTPDALKQGPVTGPGFKVF